MKQPWYRRWLTREAPQPLTIQPRPPATERECPCCGKTVGIWRTYADGQIRCVECGKKERGL